MLTALIDAVAEDRELVIHIGAYDGMEPAEWFNVICSVGDTSTFGGGRTIPQAMILALLHMVDVLNIPVEDPTVEMLRC